MLGDARALARGRERGAALPGADPVVGAAQREGARAPLDAVRADKVGDHVAVTRDAAAGQELQLGGVTAGVEGGCEVSAAVTGGERHVSAAVLVGDEHVGPGHARAGAESHPLVGGGGEDLDVDVTGPFANRRRWVPDGDAYILLWTKLVCGAFYNDRAWYGQYPSMTLGNGSIV